jgi:hypothetical protein
METISSSFTRKQYALMGFFALHFILILGKSFREYAYIKPVLERLPVLRIASEYYTQMTVLQADYSFFSPDIAPDYDVVIDVKNSQGQYQNASFGFANTEVEKRFHTCVLALQHLPDSLQDVVVKSWAARTLDTYPNTQEIKIRIEKSKVPCMQEFAAGKRKEPEKILEVVFETPNTIVNQENLQQ